MSSCLIVQKKDRLFIGADSALSVKQNDKFIRYSNDCIKLHQINNEIMFSSGNLKFANYFLDYYKKEKDILKLSQELKNICLNNNYDKNVYDVEIIISGIDKDGTYSYQLSQYNNFEPIIHRVLNNNDIKILCAGFSTRLLNKSITKQINDEVELHEAFIKSFKNISCENIGGNLLAYEINKNGISKFIEYKIDDYINDIFINNIGDMHLLVADTIVGNLLVSKKLIITNESGTYTIDEDGLTAKKNDYAVRINPDDPENIFSISIANRKLLYIDTNAKKLKFEGDIESTSGHIANYVISTNDLTSGKVGMSSNTNNNAIAFWAGNTDRNAAPFRVNNNGQLTCSNAVITGGSLKVGSNFSVNNSGILTASGANISGSITATTGKIGGWTINGNDLRGSSGSSYIRGGEINMGSGNFVANDERVSLGDFEVVYTNRGIFQSYDEFSGMSSASDGGDSALWAGYNGGDIADMTNYSLFVNGGGQVYAYDLWAYDERRSRFINVVDAIREAAASCGDDCGSDGCDGSPCPVESSCPSYDAPCPGNCSDTCSSDEACGPGDGLRTANTEYDSNGSEDVITISD